MPQRRLPWFALLLLPGLARADSLSAVDTVWIAVAAALVFFMQAGFALLESGMSRAKNALNVVMKTTWTCAWAPWCSGLWGLA